MIVLMTMTLKVIDYINSFHSFCRMSNFVPSRVTGLRALLSRVVQYSTFPARRSTFTGLRLSSHSHRILTDNSVD
jgi:hypothetical protein